MVLGVLRWPPSEFDRATLRDVSDAIGAMRRASGAEDTSDDLSADWVREQQMIQSSEVATG